MPSPNCSTAGSQSVSVAKRRAVDCQPDLLEVAVGRQRRRLETGEAVEAAHLAQPVNRHDRRDSGQDRMLWSDASQALGASVSACSSESRTVLPDHRLARGEHVELGDTDRQLRRSQRGRADLTAAVRIFRRQCSPAQRALNWLLNCRAISTMASAVDDLEVGQVVDTGCASGHPRRPAARSPSRSGKVGVGRGAGQQPQVAVAALDCRRSTDAGRRTGRACPVRRLRQRQRLAAGADYRRVARIAGRAALLEPHRLLAGLAADVSTQRQSTSCRWPASQPPTKRNGVTSSFLRVSDARSASARRRVEMRPFDQRGAAGHGGCPAGRLDCLHDEPFGEHRDRHAARRPAGSPESIGGVRNSSGRSSEADALQRGRPAGLGDLLPGVGRLISQRSRPPITTERVGRSIIAPGPKVEMIWLTRCTGRFMRCPGVGDRAGRRAQDLQSVTLGSTSRIERLATKRDAPVASSSSARVERRHQKPARQARRRIGERVPPEVCSGRRDPVGEQLFDRAPAAPVTPRRRSAARDRAIASRTSRCTSGRCRQSFGGVLRRHVRDRRGGRARPRRRPARGRGPARRRA